MKGKAAALFILFTLTVPMLATFTWLQHQKYRVRKEIKRQIIAEIDRNDLVLLKFTQKESAEELDWEHAREFEYKQHMYDVVETEIKSDSVFYWCWLDQEETELNKKLKNLVAKALGKDPQNKKSQEQLMKFFKSLYCSFPAKWKATFPHTNQMAFSYYNLQQLSIYLTPPSPPPPELV